jgi:hypothetical protein
LAASVTDIPELKLEISCTGFPHAMQEPPRDEIVAKVVEFLVSNGVPAERGVPRGIGAAAGGPELIKAASLMVKGAKVLAKMRAEMARRQVRSYLPSLTVRLESSVETDRSEWKLQTALQAADVLSVLGELSTFLRREYPLVEFSYFVSAAAGSGSWINIFTPDDRLTYSLLRRLIGKIGRKPTAQWIRLHVRRPWWFPWGRISSKKGPLDASEWDCGDPRGSLTSAGFAVLP